MKSAPLLTEQTAIHFADLAARLSNHRTIENNAMQAVGQKANKRCLNVFSAFTLLSMSISSDEDARQHLASRHWSTKRKACYDCGQLVTPISSPWLIFHCDICVSGIRGRQSLTWKSVRIVEHCRCMSWKVTEVLDETTRKNSVKSRTVDVSFKPETTVQRSQVKAARRRKRRQVSEDIVPHLMIILHDRSVSFHRGIKSAI